MKRILRSFAVLALLAACQTATSDNPVQVDQASSGAIGPGSASMDGSALSTLFGDVCANTYPDFKKARGALSRAGFIAHPETGTFYDNRRDVSFKLIEGQNVKRCSMVFSASESMHLLGFLFSAASAPNDGKDHAVNLDRAGRAAWSKAKGNSVMRLQASGKRNTKNYFRAILDRAS